MARGCAEDFSKVNEGIRDASTLHFNAAYIHPPASRPCVSSYWRRRICPVPGKLLTPLLCFATATSGGLGALQARFHQPIPGSHAAAGAEGHEKASTEGFQEPGAAEGSQGGETQRAEELHHPRPAEWWVSMPEVFQRRHKTSPEMVDN